MKVLITGAFGFVGSNLSAYLAEKGHELWALDVGRGPVGRRQSAVGSAERAQGGTEGALTANEANRANGAGVGAYSRCYGWEELAEIPWQDVDAVVHLAGKAHDTRDASDPQSYFDVNVGLTKRVSERFVTANQTNGANGGTGISHGGAESTEGFSRKDAKTPCARCLCERSPRTFILFSSVKAVADRVEGVLTEEAVPDPQTPYGRSKLEAEEEVLKFERSNVRDAGETTANHANRANGEGRADVLTFERANVERSGGVQSAVGVGLLHAQEQPPDNFRTSELPHFRTYILRPCMIHGPGNKGNLNLLHGIVNRGVPWPLGAFENRRSFASVGNVCAVVEALLKGTVASGVYQVADDGAVSTNELIGLMARASGRRVKIWRVPAGWVRAVARAGDALRLPLNSERLKKLTESYVVSNSKIKKALGWETMPIRAEEGLLKTLESFCNRQ